LGDGFPTVPCLSLDHETPLPPSPTFPFLLLPGRAPMLKSPYCHGLPSQNVLCPPPHLSLPPSLFFLIIAPTFVGTGVLWDCLKIPGAFPLLIFTSYQAQNTRVTLGGLRRDRPPHFPYAFFVPFPPLDRLKRHGACRRGPVVPFPRPISFRKPDKFFLISLTISPGQGLFPSHPSYSPSSSSSPFRFFLRSDSLSPPRPVAHLFSRGQDALRKKVFFFKEPYYSFYSFPPFF